MGIETRITTDGLKKTLLASSRSRRERHGEAVAIDRAAGDGAVAQPFLKMAMCSAGSLKGAERRVRKTSPAQLERVIRSIRQFGVVSPVLVDADRVIINGHIIVEAAKALGIATVPVVNVEHLGRAEIGALRIALNRLAETGEWDLGMLRLELGDLAALDLPVIDLGFSLPELDIIMLGDAKPAASDRELNKLPKPVDMVVTEPGDIWQLGPHRIICGDATMVETYDALLGSERAQGVFSDSPFNIPIAGFVSGLGKTKHQDFIAGVGEWTPEEFRTFLVNYLSRCREFTTPGAVTFACMDWRSDYVLKAAGQDAGLDLVNTCIWNKGSGGMGGLYRSAYEVVAVFCNGSKPATNNIALGRHGRDRCNVWNYAGANRRGSSAAKALKLHATPKPVPLVEDALCDVTNRGDLVLDPFLGSGTTLIAAHTTGRIGRGIELDPKFIDVTIRRFTELTGIEAVHAKLGRTFSDIESARNTAPE